MNGYTSKQMYLTCTFGVTRPTRHPSNMHSIMISTEGIDVAEGTDVTEGTDVIEGVGCFLITLHII